MSVVKGNFGGGGGTPPGGNPLDNVDLSNAKTLTCEKCEGKGFRQTMMLKKLSPLISPTGQEAIIPVMVFGCDSCGHINKQFEEADLVQQNG